MVHAPVNHSQTCTFPLLDGLKTPSRLHDLRNRQEFSRLRYFTHSALVLVSENPRGEFKISLALYRRPGLVEVSQLVLHRHPRQNHFDKENIRR